MLNYNLLRMLCLLVSLLFSQWSAAEHHHFDEDEHEHSVECQLCSHFQFAVAIPSVGLYAEFHHDFSVKSELRSVVLQKTKYTAHAQPRAPPFDC